MVAKDLLRDPLVRKINEIKHKRERNKREKGSSSVLVLSTWGVRPSVGANSQVPAELKSNRKRRWSLLLLTVNRSYAYCFGYIGAVYRC